jgi:hypothetical protein
MFACKLDGLNQLIKSTIIVSLIFLLLQNIAHNN